MIERLYQPDYSCIFGKKFTNAFLYPQIDSLVWPIFKDTEKSQKLQNLLALKNQTSHSNFYHRKLSLDDLKIELECSKIEITFLQAMNLNRDYGIANEDVANVITKEPGIFKAILSFALIDKKEEILQEIRKYSNNFDIVGVVLYPSYTKLNLHDPDNIQLIKLLDYLREKNVFLKIDIGNSYFPDYHDGYISKEIIQSFISKYPQNKIVLSGLDISGDFGLYYQLLKYHNNLWLELEPRTLGGMSPTNYFDTIFSISGFIQNTWHRFLIGSSSPTLEISQISRGLWEATEKLNFSQKCVLRTWGFRNAVRLKPTSYNISKEKLDKFNTLIATSIEKEKKNEMEVNVSYKVKLRSFSITQLIFLTDIIKNIFNEVHKKYPSYNQGTLFLKSYHTTTSLITNEHEYGNYLDLHFRFAEISRKDSSNYFHTVRALENRADFNRFDHDLATDFGNRQLILPISKGKLDIGNRENFYILVTFGPRTIQIYLNIRLLK